MCLQKWVGSIVCLIATWGTIRCAYWFQSSPSFTGVTISHNSFIYHYSSSSFTPSLSCDLPSPVNYPPCNLPSPVTYPLL